MNDIREVTGEWALGTKEGVIRCDKFIYAPEDVFLSKTDLERVARLMSKAPQLLAALKELSDEIDWLTEERYCLCGSNDAGTHSTACLAHQKATRTARALIEELAGMPTKEPDQGERDASR